MKKLVLIFVAFMLTGLTMKAQVDLQNGLVAHYPFNGNGNDESGNGNNGTVNGATLTTDRFGNVNSAFSFNGIDNSITVPNSNFLSPLSFSISCWIYRNGSGSNVFPGIISKYDGTSGGYLIAENTESLNGNKFGFWLSPLENIESNNAPSNINWINIIAIFENGNMKMYINGILQDKTLSNITLINNTSPLIIGLYEYLGTNHCFNGKIDDIRIYNRALNEQEIGALYIASISFDSQTVKAGRTIEIPIKTTDLHFADNFISYQFDYNYDNTQLEYIGYDLAGTIATGGNVTINTTLNNKLTVGYTTQTALQGAEDIIKLKFRVLDSGTISPTITNFKFNETSIANITNGIITSTLFYGDVTANEEISAYDAALVLQYSVGIDPMPTIDILPWENWRLKVADVDGNVGITANDASEILKYSVGLITVFPIESGKKSVKTDNADVNITLVNNELLFQPTGELFGLNVRATENISVLGQPQFLNANMLNATNITANTYAVGLATSTAPTENETFMKIPINQNVSVTFDMIINSTVKTVTVSGTTGIVTVNDKAVSVYPNPTNSILFVSGMQNANIQIFDLSGKLIINQQNTDNQINVINLQNGIYSVKITNESGTVIRKFVKQ